MSYPEYEKKQNASDVVPGFISADEALSVTTQEHADRARELQLRHNNQYRTAAAIAIGAGDVAVKAEGSYWWDVKGVKHLDFIGSVGPGLLGLNNPFVVEKVKKYLDAHLLTMDPLMLHQTTAAFSHNMALITPYLPRTVICCGGAEANETLLKMVRLASYRTKKGRTRMLSTLNAFHGKTQAPAEPDISGHISTMAIKQNRMLLLLPRPCQTVLCR
ncbi:MAG: aminotransferase class III-fold pyridoxal phosphate-dependent enzyme [Clostridiales bacterium]|nr:aminotransferase class III-fold pyridoxal phosphate-dependent enzyme [Clostridiales bacterium]